MHWWGLRKDRNDVVHLCLWRGQWEVSQTDGTGARRTVESNQVISGELYLLLSRLFACEMSLWMEEWLARGYSGLTDPVGIKWRHLHTQAVELTWFCISWPFRPAGTGLWAQWKVWADTWHYVRKISLERESSRVHFWPNQCFVIEVSPQRGLSVHVTALQNHTEGRDIPQSMFSVAEQMYLGAQVQTIRTGVMVPDCEANFRDWLMSKDFKCLFNILK